MLPRNSKQAIERHKVSKEERDNVLVPSKAPVPQEKQENKEKKEKKEKKACDERNKKQCPQGNPSRTKDPGPLQHHQR